MICNPVLFNKKLFHYSFPLSQPALFADIRLTKNRVLHVIHERYITSRTVHCTHCFHCYHVSIIIAIVYLIYIRTHVGPRSPVVISNTAINIKSIFRLVRKNDWDYLIPPRVVHQAIFIAITSHFGQKVNDLIIWPDENLNISHSRQRGISCSLKNSKGHQFSSN